MWRVWLVVAALGLAGPGWVAGALAQQGRQAPQEREAVVVNQAGQTLMELYLAPAGAAEPGQDRLGTDTLPTGSSFRVRLGRGRECRFDLRAVYQDGTEEERRGLDICRQSRVVLGDPGQPTREFTVINATDQMLRELYAARPGAAQRGPDRLGSATVASGAELRVRVGRTRDCVFDVTAVFDDDAEDVKRGVDVCRTQRLVFGDPDAPVRRVEVRNSADRVIRELYASAAGPERWGPDRLGSETLPRGERFAMSLRSRDCVFDLRAVFDDETAEEKRRVDLCAAPSVDFDGTGAPRPPERRVALLNRHLAEIGEVYLSASRSDDWGPDRLGERTLPVGERQEVSMRGECEADLRIVFVEPEAAEERRGINICQVAAIVLRPGWTVQDQLEDEEAGDRPPQPGSVRFRNRGRVPVVELYTGPPGAPRGPDRLGVTVLGVDETLDFTPEEGACRADLVAVFRDGRELVLPGLDLCAGEEVALQ